MVGGSHGRCCLTRMVCYAKLPGCKRRLRRQHDEGSDVGLGRITKGLQRTSTKLNRTGTWSEFNVPPLWRR